MAERAASAASLVLLAGLPAHRLRRRVATVLVLVVGGLFVGGVLLTGGCPSVDRLAVLCRRPARGRLPRDSGRGHRHRAIDACARGRRRVTRSRPHRAQPDRPAAHRHGAHRALQLPVREAHGRHVHPAPRGHGRGAHRRSTTSATSSTSCTGWASSGTRAPRSPASRPRDRTGRIARCSGSTATARSPSSCSREDKAYYCYCTPEQLDADRKAQEAAHQPPHYVGRCAHLTAAERARATRPQGSSRSSGSASGRGSSPSTTSSAATSRSTRRRSAAT